MSGCRDAGGDAPEEGTGMLRCQGFAFSSGAGNLLWQTSGRAGHGLRQRAELGSAQPVSSPSSAEPSTALAAAWGSWLGTGGAAGVWHWGDPVPFWDLLGVLPSPSQLVFLSRILIRCLNVGQNVFPAAGTPRHCPRKVERRKSEAEAFQPLF